MTQEATPSRDGDHPPHWRHLTPVRKLISAAVTAMLRTRAHIASPARERLVSGRAILTSNHVSLLDGVLLVLVSPTPLAVGVDTDWSVKSAWAARGMGLLCWLGYGWVVPLDSSTPQGLRKLARHLNAGRSVLIFPEGGISPDGSPQPEKPGLFWLAARTGAQVVSAQIEGAARSRIFAKSGDHWWPRIRITVGA